MYDTSTATTNTPGTNSKIIHKIPTAKLKKSPRDTEDILDWYDWVEEFEEDLFNGGMGRREWEMYNRVHRKKMNFWKRWRLSKRQR